MLVSSYRSTPEVFLLVPAEPIWELRRSLLQYCGHLSGQDGGSALALFPSRLTSSRFAIRLSALLRQSVLHQHVEMRLLIGIVQTMAERLPVGLVRY